MKQQATTVRVFGLIARCLFALLLVFTSFYSVLAYIPDTYHAFIQAPFMAWIPMLIRFQPFLYALLAGAVSISLWMDRDGDRVSRRLVLEFIIAAVLVSIYLMIARPYSSLHNDSHSFVLALATIFPILWIGILLSRVLAQKRLDSKGLSTIWHGAVVGDRSGSRNRVSSGCLFALLECGNSPSTHQPSGSSGLERGGLLTSSCLVW